MRNRSFTVLSLKCQRLLVEGRGDDWHFRLHSSRQFGGQEKYPTDLISSKAAFLWENLKLDSWSGSHGLCGAKETMIWKRIILLWQPWALWLTNGVPRWRSQRILSGRSEKYGRTGTVCRITIFKSPPIISMLILGLKLESMNVNTSNCKSDLQTWPSKQSLLITFLAKIVFSSDIHLQSSRHNESGGSLFYLGCRWPQVFF